MGSVVRLRSFEADLARYAGWFNEERPYQGLDNRTPDYFHEGRRRVPPRRTPASATGEVRYLGNDRALPVLRFRRAA